MVLNNDDALDKKINILEMFTKNKTSAYTLGWFHTAAWNFW